MAGAVGKRKPELDLTASPLRREHGCCPVTHPRSHGFLRFRANLKVGCDTFPFEGRNLAPAAGTTTTTFPYDCPRHSMILNVNPSCQQVQATKQ